MRRLMCLLVSVFVAGSALAQAPAVQQQQIQLQVSYPAETPAPTANGGQQGQAAIPAPPAMTSITVPAVLFLPPGQDRRSAIVFAHDGGQGLTDAVKARCRDLAREGFVVLAPDYRGDGVGKAVKNKAAIHTFMEAREYLNNHPRVKQNFVGIMGASQGGYLALQTAIKDRGHWNCVVQAGGAIDVPSTRTRIMSRVLLQHGDEDNVVLRKHANYLDATLRKAGTSCELKEYTLLDHNFWFWEGKNYSVEQQQQADWAWSDVVAFLHDNLQSDNAATGVK